MTIAQIIDGKFKVIKLTLVDAIDCGFGDMGVCTCAECNKKCGHNDMYYIAVLNDIMCQFCYLKFITRHKPYCSDKRIENRNFNYYKNILHI